MRRDPWLPLAHQMRAEEASGRRRYHRTRWSQLQLKTMMTGRIGSERLCFVCFDCVICERAGGYFCPTLATELISRGPVFGKIKHVSCTHR